MSSRAGFMLIVVVLVGVVSQPSFGDDTNPQFPGRVAEFSLAPEQWRRVDVSVDRALEFLATQQGRDGSFASIDTGQPGVTALSVLAFLSRGHVPGEGPYGKSLSRAVDFVLSQQQENGLLFDKEIGPWQYGSAAHTGIYNHAISGLMLTEIYGMGATDQEERLRVGIEKACDFTLNHQSRFNRNRQEQGGWRYLRLSDQRSDADLSITSWQLLFLRSARNAEFEVPQPAINDAMDYVERCFDPNRGTFVYCIVSGRMSTPAMAGAGILSLALGGRHDSEQAQRAGRWMAQQPFDRYPAVDRYHYSAYYCSQAAFQLGGEYWSKFYPRLEQALTASQRPDGSWNRESRDSQYGNVYSTALSVLALTPPYQILPIYQR
ncbi:MAG: terpene cyclase/mutase family protein [Planctomycetaceae bacterium]|nr:terpene cyclase/mutase family protein [Planctomycetaceae bacterium]